MQSFAIRSYCFGRCAALLLLSILIVVRQGNTDIRVRSSNHFRFQFTQRINGIKYSCYRADTHAQVGVLLRSNGRVVWRRVDSTRLLKSFDARVALIRRGGVAQSEQKAYKNARTHRRSLRSLISDCKTSGGLLTQNSGTPQPTVTIEPTPQSTLSPTVVATESPLINVPPTPTLNPTAVATATALPTSTPTSEPTPAPACQNGYDDDGDGPVDFPADPGCSSSSDDDERASSTHRAKLASRAGVLARIALPKNETDREKILTHSLLDGAILNYAWSDLEPTPGQYNFAQIDADLALWSSYGKKVIIQPMLYNQNPRTLPSPSADNDATPGWFFEENPDLRICFNGGGQADNELVCVPKVWEATRIDVVSRYIAPLVGALANRYDSNPSMFYVMPGIGHIGNLTAQPSNRNGEGVIPAPHAFYNHGWTPALWADYVTRTETVYQDVFVNTPLLIKAAGILLNVQNPAIAPWLLPLAPPHFSDTAELLLGQSALLGISGVHFGITDDQGAMLELLQKIDPNVFNAARDGINRFGFGDDWPLFRDAAGGDSCRFQQLLNNAFEVPGFDSIPTSLLFVQTDDLLQTADIGNTGNNPTCTVDARSALEEARQRLFEVSVEIFDP